MSAIGLAYANHQSSKSRVGVQTMTMPTPNFQQQHADVKEFTEAAVSYVMQQLLNRRQGQYWMQASAANNLRAALVRILRPFACFCDVDISGLAQRFVWDQLPDIIEVCEIDAARYIDEDPAIEYAEEVFFGCNGFWATVAHRIANALHGMKTPVVPRSIAGYAHSKTGIDIHPATTIGSGLFIDHGTGVAIGCTAVLGKNVNIYKGVVLGTRSKPRKQTEEQSGQLKKRHPTIGDHVSLYTNAFVGGDILVGDGAVVGAYAFVTDDVPAGSVVLANKD